EKQEMQEASQVPPAPDTQKSPAQRQPLENHFVPFVARAGGQDPDSFRFLFYRPNYSNSYSPFYTSQKPTCGYLYSRSTDHTRKVLDVPSANVMAW
ncbi:hypothetical protein N300_10486, partial [Calypte anna]